MESYEKKWRELRRLEDLRFLSICVFGVFDILVYLVLRQFGWMVAIGGVVGCSAILPAYYSLKIRAWRCPGCGERFFESQWTNSVSNMPRCAHCRLPNQLYEHGETMM